MQQPVQSSVVQWTSGRLPAALCAVKRGTYRDWHGCRHINRCWHKNLVLHRHGHLHFDRGWNWHLDFDRDWHLHLDWCRDWHLDLNRDWHLVLNTNRDLRQTAWKQILPERAAACEGPSWSGKRGLAPWWKDLSPEGTGTSRGDWHLDHDSFGHIHLVPTIPTLVA